MLYWVFLGFYIFNNFVFILFVGLVGIVGCFVGRGEVKGFCCFRVWFFWSFGVGISFLLVLLVLFIRLIGIIGIRGGGRIWGD